MSLTKTTNIYSDKNVAKSKKHNCNLNEKQTPTSSLQISE